MKTKIIWLLGFGLFFLNTNFVHAEFTDQTEIPAWGLEAVEALLEAGYINGNDDGSLAPNRTINRAEFLKILTSATEATLVQTSHADFPDVADDVWFSPYVHTAVSLGWAQGYPDGYFRPGNTINRAEIAKLLVEAFGLDLASDTSGAWYEIYLRTLNNQGLLPYQVNLNDAEPGKNPSRIETFEQLHRLLMATAPAEVIAPVQLPAGQISEQPAENDDKFLTFTPETKDLSTTTKLNVKSADAGNKQSVNLGQNNITLMSLNLLPTGSTQIKGLQLRRVGNGDFSDFENLWVEYSQQIISPKISPQSDFVYLQFSNPITISQSKNIVIKSQVSSTANRSSSSRWVLFMPDWINSNARETIGLFPIAGRDVNIR